MKLLAVDTSCDEASAAILDTDRWLLLSDVVHSHVTQMARYGGIVPEIASREHLKTMPMVVQQALDQANLSLKDIDWFAATNRPGLIGALLVGLSFTKALSFAENRPFSSVNHIEGHLYSPMLATLEGQKVPEFPWIALVVSGGHSELFHVKDESEFEWLGGTRDDAAGEAFDKIGKLLGLGYPAGPKIDVWVQKSATNEDRARFPFPRASVEGLDFSFSGLKTAVAQQIAKLPPLAEATKLQIAASAQEAILQPLIEKARLASERLGVRQIVVTGGVACNSRLREKLPDAYFPQPRHCSDNAAMIALVAALYHRRERLFPSPLSETAFAR